VVVLGLLILIVVGAIIGMTQVECILSAVQCSVQGMDKLQTPFLNSLSNYDETRQTALEITWDQTQKDVSTCD
jgi:hypothetical protein